MKTEDIPHEINVPDSGADYTLQAFLWSGEAFMKPLVKKTEMKTATIF